MSGASPDDQAKEQIIALLSFLRKNAVLNNDKPLIAEIDELISKVYNLQTY